MSTMKILFSLFFALTIPAYALPKVGDSATYSVDDEEGGTTKSGIVTMTLMKIEAGAEKPYVFRVTTQVGGQQKIVTDARAEDLVTSDEKIEELLANCAAQVGGTLEKVTVPAGTFDACTFGGLTNDAGDEGFRFSIGRVPLGLIKAERIKKNLFQTQKLLSFKKK